VNERIVVIASDESSPFRDRADAGRRLAERLRGEARPDAVVVGLQRGGRPVAAEVARALGAPLDRLIIGPDGGVDGPEASLGGRAVLLIDDAVESGGTMRRAVAIVAAQRPARLVVAVPAGNPATCEGLRALGEVDEVVALLSPDPFPPARDFYERFDPAE
jgi:putative phosphoribosyl transferase